MSAIVSPIDSPTLEFKSFRIDMESGARMGCGPPEKGRLDERVLDLGYDTIQVTNILRAECLDKRVSITEQDPQNDDGVLISCMEIPDPKIAKQLTRKLNQLCSKIQARKEEAECLAFGKEFRSKVCPYCLSTINLTEFPKSPQVYSTFCYSLFEPNKPVDQLEAEMDICDRCVLYSRPRPYRYSSYHYHLLYDEVQTKTRNLCLECIKKKARKQYCQAAMLLVTIPIVWCLYRRDTKDQELPAGHGQLNEANRLVDDAKHLDKALNLYRAMLSKQRADAGVHYNMAFVYAARTDWVNCATEAQTALDQCSSYEPAASLLIRAYTEMGGRHREITMLQIQFGLPSALEA